MEQSLRDPFGNLIDPMLGYAPGQILGDSVAHVRRRRRALAELCGRVSTGGWDAVCNFTGHSRRFVVEEAGLACADAEEWVRQSAFEPELVARAITHFGGSEQSSAAVFNRSSACIVATVSALVPAGGNLISVAPRRRSHPSIRQAARLVGARLVEAEPDASTDWAALPDAPLVMLTRVTSELDVVAQDRVTGLIRAAQEAGKLVFVDDAYGAQLAPALLGQGRALTLGADLAVTSCDKAGLAGPRGGLLAGRADRVDQILGRASELGLEARAPVALGVLAALRLFRADDIRADCDIADSLSEALAARLGPDSVIRTIMGPTIDEEAAMRLALKRSGQTSSLLVPCEVTCLIAIRLMRLHGFLTSNVAERPGARVSLRLRTVARDIARFGGIGAVVAAVDEAICFAAGHIADLDGARRIILGEDPLRN